MTDTHPIPMILTANRFRLGQVVVTANAHDRLDRSVLAHALTRHAAGDWGDLDAEDAAANEEALTDGGRLFSAYGTGDNRVWVITEADRSVTTVLLPEDY